MSGPTYVEARTVEDAVGLLGAVPGARIIGGGTGLMLMARSGFLGVDALVGLGRVDDPELRTIALDPDSIRIGALCTLTSIERHPQLGREVPVLRSTLARLSSVRTRNVATAAGCVVHGDPHMDLPPVLMALGASLTVENTRGRRKVDCATLYRGYYDVALEPDDVVVALELPRPRPGSYTAYRKFTGALAEDWPVVGLALRLETDDGRVSEVAASVSAVEGAARRLPEVERALTGTAVDDIEAAAVGEVAAGSVEPIDDHLGSAWYKRKVLAAETTRAIDEWRETRTP